ATLPPSLASDASQVPVWARTPHVSRDHALPLWFAYAATFAPTVAISPNVVHPAPAHRSIRKPSSLPLLSCHARLICVAETAVAVRPLGAGSGVAALAVRSEEHTSELQSRSQPVCR